MIRMGLIGLSHDHVWDLLPDMAANEHVELVAATSTKPPLLERIGKEFGVATFTDSTEMAASQQLDAVCLFGDNRAGAEEGVKALERGWHVLIEKPLAADLDRGRSTPANRRHHRQAANGQLAHRVVARRATRARPRAVRRDRRGVASALPRRASRPQGNGRERIFL